MSQSGGRERVTKEELAKLRAEHLAVGDTTAAAIRLLTQEVVALREQRNGGGGNGYKATWHRVRYEVLVALVCTVAGLAFASYLDVRDLKDQSHPPAEVLLKIETLEKDVGALEAWRIRITEGR